jgi:flagellar basal-body rod protein FlgF
MPGRICPPQPQIRGKVPFGAWHGACASHRMDNTTSIALSRLSAQSRAMDMIAGNLANMSTPGYRAQRMVFADWLSPQTRTTAPRGDRQLAYTQDRATYREQAEGALTQTGNPLDLALSGDGFFTVRTSAGTRLTRAGRFTLQNSGTITDEAGNALLDVNNQPITVGATDTKITVTADGAISSQNRPIGKIAIVKPSDANRITAEGGRLFRADVPTAPVAAPRIVQGAVEDSNVQPVAELVRMMSTERDFQFVTQFVQSESQRHQDAIDKIAAPA